MFLASTTYDKQLTIEKTGLSHQVWSHGSSTLLSSCFNHQKRQKSSINHHHHKSLHYFPGQRKIFFLNVIIIFPENFLKCHHYFPRQRKKKFMEEIDFLSLLEHFQEVVARHQLARYEDKQNLPKKSKNLWQDNS